jgi:hypothetical protein
MQIPMTLALSNILSSDKIFLGSLTLKMKMLRTFETSLTVQQAVAPSL